MLKNNTPIFSVLSPTYNCAVFIRRSYECLLAQENQNWEWIVVNDGSTDSTLDVLNSIKDDRVKVHTYENNKGRGYARNYGISEAIGEIIVVWDIDDIYLPERLSEVFNAIKIEGYDFFTSKAFVVDNEFNLKGERGFYQKEFYTSIVHPTLAFKRELREFLAYDKSMKAGEDFNVIIILTNKFKGLYSNKLLMLYFEDREINLRKTINMHNAHLKTILNIFKHSEIPVNIFVKLKYLGQMLVKKVILAFLTLKPSVYLKSVKYRKLHSLDQIASLDEKKELMSKYKQKFSKNN